MRMIKERGYSVYYKQNIFGGEVIVGDTRFFFTTQRGLKTKKNMFLFGMVKRDVKKYLLKHTLKKSTWSPSVHFNSRKFPKDAKIIGYDMDSAYWNIAFSKLKMISANTYWRGIKTGDKGTMNISLSSLGTDKYYKKTKNGFPTRDVYVIRGDDQLKEVYTKVRHTCFKMMKKLAGLLDRYYICYKTDCIYFVKTPRSVAIAKKFLDAQDLDYKVLHESARDIFEGIIE